MRKLPAIALGCAVAVLAYVACAVLVAVVVAILDIYLAGHNLPTLTRPWVDHGFFRFSRADALMNSLAGLGGALAGTLVARAFGWSDTKR